MVCRNLPPKTLLLHDFRISAGYSEWAFPVSGDHFPNPHDAWQILQDFMRYCNIVEPPVIQRGLFT